MSTPVSSSHDSSDAAYVEFERLIAARVAGAVGPLFVAEVDREALWLAYLKALPAEYQQIYTCGCCCRFIQRYGPLVTIDEQGAVATLLWKPDDVPVFFLGAVQAMRLLVEAAPIERVFVSSDETWGVPQTGEWTHLHGTSRNVFASQVATAAQRSAELSEDYRQLRRALSEVSLNVVRQAVRVLSSEALYRGETTLGVAQWFRVLHESLAKESGPRRERKIWLAVAGAPVGFCHIRSSMIGTLLDDINDGLPFDDVKRRWAAKMHPLQYQRPQAAPKAGAIREAERLFETLGLASALQRRYATLDDVLSKVWISPEPLRESSEPTSVLGAVSGIFSHLTARAATRSGGASLKLPRTTMTIEKFMRKVLPGAWRVEVWTPAVGPYCGLLTATDPDAEPLLQWDGLAGRPRNPVSLYVYHNGSRAEKWGLKAGRWTAATAVFLGPHAWQEPERFRHHGDRLLFALEGAREVEECRELALFPENLRHELHGVRSVIEAYSKSRRPTGRERGDANGIVTSGGDGLVVRVLVDEEWSEYVLDRWD